MVDSDMEYRSVQPTGLASIEPSFLDRHPPSAKAGVNAVSTLFISAMELSVIFRLKWEAPVSFVTLGVIEDFMFQEVREQILESPA